MRTTVRVDHLWKKYCHNLRLGIGYALKDLVVDSLGLQSDRSRLRPGERWSLQDVSFTLRRGQCLGLVGANGAGKSTLLKIINGLIKPDVGEVRVCGRVGALIEVGAGFHPQLTGRENVYLNGSILGMSREEIDHALESIVDFAGLDGGTLEAPVRTYSSGMVVRLGFSVAIHCNVDVLLIDEVLAVGDMNFQAKCLNAIGGLREKGTTIVLVSHNLNHIAGWADHCLVLSDGRCLAFDSPTPAIQAYADRMQELRLMAESQTRLRPPAGSGRVRILRTTFRQGGQGRDGISAGEPLELTVDVAAQDALGDTELDLKLFGPADRLLVGASSRYRDQTVSLPAGRSTIRAEFPPVPVNSGYLRPSVALWTAGRAELLDWHEGLPCVVHGIAASQGELHWMPRYTVHVTQDRSIQ